MGMWRVDVPRSVDRALERIPADDRERILGALAEMVQNPFAGDTKTLGDDEYRRRVCSYRIFFDLHRNQRIIFVSRVERRTSTTY
jgi:mRNA-degrading endonuclease RelE of RelBE toxin-antitoxin system